MPLERHQSSATAIKRRAMPCRRNGSSVYTLRIFPRRAPDPIELVSWLRGCTMSDHSVHKVGELAHDERLLVERWLGRALSNDETISLNAYRPHPAPTG
jgi:hypothetical protein